MGVSTTTNTRIYNGDGSTTAFAFPFYFFRTSDFLVYLYNTTTGAITPQTLGVNYTVSGTPNAQGLYPNGGTINMVAAPASGVSLAVIRAPVETQTFGLINSGLIPSAQLVQQMDFLTLLTQWLQDQVNRAVAVPPGFSPSFSPFLPSDLAIIQAAQTGSGVCPVVKADRSGFDLAANWPTVNQITLAQGYSVAAAASATAAAGSATAASGSATAAAGSATAAAASAASIGTPWQEFLTGVYGGVDTVFTMSHPPVAAAELLAVLGSTPQEAVVDFTRVGAVITFPGIDVSGQKLFVKGRY